MRAARLISGFLLGWVWSGPAIAQSYADLYGKILDTSEAGIGEAAVTVVNQDTGFRRTAQSEPGGGYVVGSLQPGIYKITVRKEGFRSVIQFGVRLASAAATRADFTLPVGSIEESVTVTGTAPMLDRQDASTGGEFDFADLDRLPLNGRGLLTLLELVPGTNVIPATRGEAGQFTTSGQRPNTNYFTVDGVSANIGVSAGGLPAQSTGGALPALSAFGSLDSLISMDAVEESRLQTSTTVAEFGRLPGASVALSSRSGSSELHGATAYRLRNELLSANDWFANQAGYPRAPLRFGDFSQTLGGPLKRNRTFFFLSYERIALRQPYVWSQAVPSLDFRQTAANWAQPVLGLFPQPTQPQLGGALDLAQSVVQNTRPAGLNAGSARIDQAITSRVSFFARYSDAPSTNQFGSSAVNQLDLRSQGLTLGLNARVTPRTILDTRVNESQATADSVWTEGDPSGAPGCVLAQLTSELYNAPEPCNALVRLSISGLGQVVSGNEGLRRQRQFQTVQTVTMERGKHALKFGLDYRRVLALRRDADPLAGLIADSVYALTDSRYFWKATSPAISASTAVQELSLWAQDTWQVSRRLTVAAGLRWEFSPAPTDPENFLDPTSNTVVSATQPLWPVSYTDFAPRLGLAYRMTEDGRTVLRAGAGLYYNSSMSIATDVINGGPLSITGFQGGANTGLYLTDLKFGFMPGLQLPKVVQWNVSLEHAFGAHDVASLSYVGTDGSSLIRREAGGAGTDNTNWVALTTNHGSSNYQALQLQYRRHVVRGLEGVASYAWSHSLDNDSSDAFLVWAGPGASPALDHGSSDFDLRHSLTAALGYQAPRALGGWSLDAIFHVRSGFPITVLEQEQYEGISLVNAFRPNLVWGQPLWVDDSSVPGGRRLNWAAFGPPLLLQQGTLGRNGITGFGMWQADLAVRREFRLAERRSLQVRVEAFNALNHSNLADPVKYLDSPVFGQSTSMLNMMLGTGSPGSGLAPILQTGGPRNIQISLHLHF